MEVTDALIDNLASLSRLHFTEGEKSEIKSDLQRMIAFIDKLNELNTEGVQPVLHMSDGSNVFREDVIEGSISREEGLKNAPDTDGVFFKVPKVIRKL
jgi:aspartyl-tRNA(Asn)/glutamyl-tRNA(Gln) amidotransferase subunit C